MSSSSRTSRRFGPADSQLSLLDWRPPDTAPNGPSPPPRTSEPRTAASGSSSLLWATPIASEARQGFQDRTRGKRGAQESLSTQVMKPQGGAGTAPLNPAWVEALMGFDPGWTELPPEVIAGLSRPARSKRSGSPRALRKASPPAPRD